MLICKNGRYSSMNVDKYKWFYGGFSHICCCMWKDVSAVTLLKSFFKIVSVKTLDVFLEDVHL